MVFVIRISSVDTPDRLLGVTNTHRNALRHVVHYFNTARSGTSKVIRRFGDNASSFSDGGVDKIIITKMPLS